MKPSERIKEIYNNMASLYEIKELKRRLYGAILTIPDDKIRDCDVRIGFALCKDPDIQSILRQSEKENPKT